MNERQNMFYDHFVLPEAVNVFTCKKTSELTCIVFFFGQLMDKFEDYLFSFEENMVNRLSRIEQRLESLETAVS